MTKVEKVAKAIAWTTLSKKGKQTCIWETSFAESEKNKFRVMAAAAIKAINDHSE